MARFIFNRLISMIFVLLATLVIIFTLMYFVPGDPAISLLGESATIEAVKDIHTKLGLDDPYLVRLGRCLWDFVRADFGISYRSKTPVFGEIMARYPTTLKLTLGSTILGILIGVSAGIVSAVKQYSIFDRVFTTISLFGASAPSFWLAMVLVLIFSLWLGWLPATGSYELKYWLLPVFTMGLQCSAFIMRMTRSSMLEVIRQDYVRTARAKGQTEMKIIINHALRNALIPILTVTGMRLCGLLGGSVLVETVFALPGIGKYILDSVSFQDYPVVQGGVMWICFNCVVITFIIDMLYGAVDPRIRSMYGVKKLSRRQSVKEV
ncbi:peptide ABC transporter permease [Synergistales bacterium]|nr:peptide ABC transporter permease [Synergistales bacterium]